MALLSTLLGISKSDLEALLAEAADGHADAFVATDGYDPEWPAWYGRYLAERLDGKSEAELETLLREADRRFTAEGLPFEKWPSYYAEYFLKRW